MTKLELPPGLTPREAEIVEIVREFADALRQEFTRDLRALLHEQREIYRDLFAELHRELYASTAKAQECADKAAKMFPIKQP